MTFTREQTLARLRERIDAGVPIIGGGAGTGISAKFEEAGGIDLIVIYNSGRYRMAGRGSLAGLMPYGDANAIVMEMAGEVLPVVNNTPVLAGVCASDPFRLMDQFLDQIRDIGFAGVQNFPTVGLIDGQFRANLEETGMGYDNEVELIRLARAKRPAHHALRVRRRPRREQMVDAGADIIVAHMGLTTKGTIGANTARTLDDCVRDVQAIADAARGSPQRRHHPLPRRPHRDARRRPIRSRPHQRRPRLLRRILDGTTARRNRHHRASPQVQSHPLLSLAIWRGLRLGCCR